MTNARTQRLEGLWHLPLILAGLTTLAPLAFMLATALAPAGEAFKVSDSLWELLFPKSWNWQNFGEVWERVPFLRYYINSFVVAICLTAGQVMTSACAAYAFARLKWPGRDRLFLCYLATMMVPGAVTMLPNFIMMKFFPEVMNAVLPFVDWKALRYFGTGADAAAAGRLVGLDSYFALIAPGMFSAYGTFLLRQFLLSIPGELEEAARIDGAGHWRMFWQIILPLALPGVATLTIFTFLGAWGSFLWPLVTTNLDALRTLPVGLQAFQGQYGTEWNLMMAAAILMLIPSVLIFLAGQRFFISGLTVGAVKG